MRAHSLQYVLPVLAIAVLSLAVIPGAFGSLDHPSNRVAGRVLVQTNSRPGTRSLRTPTLIRAPHLGRQLLDGRYRTGSTRPPKVRWSSPPTTAGLAVDAGSNQISVFSVRTSTMPYLTLGAATE